MPAFNQHSDRIDRIDCIVVTAKSLPAHFVFFAVHLLSSRNAAFLQLRRGMPRRRVRAAAIFLGLVLLADELDGLGCCARVVSESPHDPATGALELALVANCISLLVGGALQVSLTDDFLPGTLQGDALAVDTFLRRTTVFAVLATFSTHRASMGTRQSVFIAYRHLTIQASPKHDTFSSRRISKIYLECNVRPIGHYLHLSNGSPSSPAGQHRQSPPSSPS